MARVLSSVASTDLVEAEAGDRGALSLGGLLSGVEGLIGGFAAAIWLALVTLGERLLRVPWLYDTRADVWTHLAAEVAAGAGLWLILFAAITAIAQLVTRVPRGSRARRMTGHVVAVVLGAAFGAFVCYFVLRRSAYWLRLPAAAWWALSVGPFALGALGARWVLALPPPRRAFGFGCAVLVLLVPLEVWTLEHYIRAYGYLLAILQVGMALAAAVGVRLVALGVPSRRTWRSAVLALLAVAALALSASPQSYAARRAVLAWGGVSKHFTLDVLWPLFDRDGDGIPSVLWGADPDDHNPRVTPVPGLAEGPARPAAAPSEAAPVRARPFRDLLFVIVDAARLDSFEGIVATDPAVQRAFASFGYYQRFTTCSTRTDQVLVQLLGRARCDDRPLPRGTDSLLAALRAEGYRDRAFRYYGVKLEFAADEVVADDRVVVERARRALEQPSDSPRAIFVHLKGGHNEYEPTGGSVRERYERQLHLAFSRVASLLELAPPERFTAVVLGDHGEAFGEHMSFAHANMLYEEVLSTPLLIRSPLVAPGPHLEPTGCADVAWHVLAGLELANPPASAMPREYAALDLMPGQFGRTQHESMRALRVGSHKVIYTAQSGIWELFDLAADPLERHSLADRRPALLGGLREELLRVASSCVVPPTVGILH